jgi:hypothetical protein
MSGKMAAIVGYILGESWTEPEIAALSVTSDGFVLTDAEFFGEAADLDRNLLNLLVAAEVTPEERADFERRYRERVDDWRPVLSGPLPATTRLTRPDFGATDDGHGNLDAGGHERGRWRPGEPNARGHEIWTPRPTVSPEDTVN